MDTYTRHKKFKLGYVPVFGYWGRWQRLGRIFYKYYTVMFCYMNLNCEICRMILWKNHVYDSCQVLLKICNYTLFLWLSKFSIHVQVNKSIKHYYMSFVIGYFGRFLSIFNWPNIVYTILFNTLINYMIMLIENSLDQSKKQCMVFLQNKC